jgi:hypothetical protein
MCMLAQTPATFADLLERTGLGQAELAHSLAALFHSGGLTTDPESARRAENHTRLSISLLKLDGEETDSDLKDRFRGSDQSAPSSILREAIHSPLRTSNRKS